VCTHRPAEGGDRERIASNASYSPRLNERKENAKSMGKQLKPFFGSTNK
jgi:hypothetical protein